MTAVLWGRGRPKTPGLYWVSLEQPWTPAGDRRVSYVGWAYKDCECKRCPRMELYLYSAGSTPVENLVRDDSQIRYLEIGTCQAETGWRSSPNEAGHWFLRRDGRDHVVILRDANSLHGNYLWRDGGSFSGSRSSDGGIWHRMSVPAAPKKAKTKGARHG